MSAFMVCNETLSMLANMITRGYYAEPYSFGFTFPEEIYDGVVTDENIFNALADLNVRSLQQRYSDYDDMIGEVEYIKGSDIWKPGLGVQPWHYQFYKSLQCYLYQCCEGKCMNDPLYKALEKLEINLAQYIAMHQPGYELAKWK